MTMTMRTMMMGGASGSSLVVVVVVAVVLLAGALGVVPATAQLALRLHSDGTYDVRVHGQRWLKSADTSFFVDGKWLSVDKSQLKLANNVTSHGKNSYGSYKEYTMTWEDASSSFKVDTSFQVFEDGKRIMFSQSWASGANNTSAGSTDNVLSSFPSFDLSHKPPLHMGCVEWFGTFIDDSHHGPSIGEWPSGTRGGKGGGPLALFDRDSNDALVVAAASQFMTASVEKTDRALRAGILGSVEEVPAGFSVSFSLVFSDAGINNAMTTWGDALLKHYKKPRDGPSKDFTLQYLGYNTDHGAYYYYNPRAANFNASLVGVYNSAKKRGIPYRWILLDSWWYFKGTNNGVKNWTAMADVFPPGGTEGLADFHRITNWPIIGHNRYWSNNTDYARQNGGDFEFSDTKYAMVAPLEQAFWDFLLSSSKKWGLRVYEQDWLYNEFNGVPLLTQSISMARTWLLQMGRAAHKNNLTIQYCMAYPRHALQSVEIPAVTQIRASDDYVPGARGPDQWRLGSSSIFAHALALAPFKDNFWTTPREKGASTGPLGHDHAVWREAAVATLSTGPVTPADGVEFQNKELIMRSCRPDGLLLNPDRPAVSMDETFKGAAFGRDFGAVGQLWTTYSTVSTRRFHHIFAAEMKNTFDVHPYSLSLDRATPTNSATSAADNAAVAYALANTTSLDVSMLMVQLFSRTSPISIRPQSNPNTFALWHTAPVHDNGVALLGELSKWVPTSSKRIAAVTELKTAITVDVFGVEGETVTLHFAYVGNKSDVTTKAAHCTVPNSGKCSITSP